MKNTSTTNIVMIIIVLISFAGGMLIIYSTNNGPWGFTDPVVYISTARSILNGNGLAYFEANAKLNPLSQYPPLIPILLSIIGFFNVDLIVAFRWLNIILFMATILISGWIFVRYSLTPVIGIFSSALLCFFPGMVTMFSSTYSEQMFIFLLLVGGVYLLEYIQNENKRNFIIGTFLVGLLPITRYLGISILASASIFIFLFASGSVRKRIKKAALFGIVASIPILLWFLHVYFVSKTSLGKWTINPALGDISLKFQDFRALFMDTVWKWIPFQSMTTSLHYKTRFVMLGLVILVIVGLSILAVRRLHQVTSKKDMSKGIQIFSFYGITTLLILLFLISSYLFSHPQVAIDDRMLLPFFVSSIMSLFGGFSLWQHTWFNVKNRWIQIIPFLLVIICAYWYIPQALDKVQIYHSGYGLTINKWRNSEMILAVRSLPGDQPVISNEWELLLLWTGRPIYGFWNTFPSEPLQITPYGTNTSDPVQEVFCKHGAALVLFSDFQEQGIEIKGQDFLQQIPFLIDKLSIYGEYSDGIIYLCP